MISGLEHTIQSSGEDGRGRCSVIMCNHKGGWIQDTQEL